MTGGSALVGRAALERLADAGLDAAADDGVAGVEVMLQRDAGGLTRVANSQVIQNVWREDLAVSVRVVTDDARVGVAGVHTDDPAAVADAARNAVAIARVSPPDPDFPGIAPAAEVGEVYVDETTVAASPDDRAAVVRALLAEVDDAWEAAGTVATGGAELGVFTSAGQAAYAPRSAAGLTVLVMGPSSSGWAEGGGRALSDVDPAAAGRRAVAKAAAGRDPVDVDAGSWAVVLEPPAVASLAAYLGYVCFNGRSFIEDRSFASGRLGETVVDPCITLVDDARSRDAVGWPVDAEGTPTRAVDLIRDGRLAGVTHDRYTARQAGTESTGHALPAPNTWGPLPLFPLFAPGGGTIDDLVGGLDRGLLVTRVHYTNVVHPKQTRLTGMTRDGTFLVEQGRVVGAVRNLRFTQSAIDALAGAEAVSAETGWGDELFGGGGRQPALRLRAFSFTSTTSFG